MDVIKIGKLYSDAVTQMRMQKECVYYAKSKIDEVIDEIKGGNLSMFDTYKAGNLRISRVYQLAAVIYSHFSEEKAMEYYKLFHYFLLEEYIWETKKEFQQEEFYLYSFRGINNYSIKDIEDSTINFAVPTKMNDPFDTLAIKWCQENNLNNLIDNTMHLHCFRNSWNYYRIRSFVAQKDFGENDKGIVDNMLMWSHYGDGHRGYCIKYKFSKDFVFNVDAYNYSARVLLPIVYKEEAFSIEKKSIKIMDAFKRKSWQWHYENEIRLLDYNPTKEADYIQAPLDAKSKICEIIFGYSCSHDNITKIKEKFKDIEDIKFSQIYSDKNDIYTLKTKAIE